jgi:predicted regulator of Ras-like GTPase activity (Roadblock/LC7/MglB family)
MAYSRYLILYQREAERLRVLCDTLREMSRAKGVYLIDSDGQLLESSGEFKGLDTTALASLTAAYNASAVGIFKIIEEKAPTNQLLEGGIGSLFFSVISNVLIVGVLFDSKSNLGLVRLRTKKVGEELAQLLAQRTIDAKNNTKQEPDSDLFSDVTGDDIDHLFDD